MLEFIDQVGVVTLFIEGLMLGIVLGWIWKTAAE